MIVQLRGCKIVEYRMACEDMVRLGYTRRRDERASRIAAELRDLGGWLSPADRAESLRSMEVPF